MPVSPSSSANEARTAIAVKLRELRLDAGLASKALSAVCGWHPAKTTRIEHATATPTDADIRAWCHACGADSAAPDIIAASRTAESMYLEWRRLNRTGLRREHERTTPLYERTKLTRTYVSTLVPGLTQTRGYATALLQTITNFQSTPDDVAHAVEARMRRSNVIRDGRHQFGIVIEESVLYFQIGDNATMVEQLDYLLEVMTLPSIAFGVIPARTPRRMWTLEAFTIYDNDLVFVELLTAAITITAPREIHDYIRAFSDLTSMAVFGSRARALVENARAAW